MSVKQIDVFLFTDTYVKVCVLVQNKVLKTKKTEVLKKTDSPNYNESFTLKLPVTSLDAASLSLTIMQHSSGHKGQSICGEKNTTEFKSELNYLQKFFFFCFYQIVFEICWFSFSDKIIGRVILGSFMFARGKELDHWNEMVANQRDQVTQWHGLV